MKILHTADWHLGKKLFDKSRAQEQKDVLEEIISIATNENVDLILVAGDLFDTFTPSAEAEDLLYSTLKTLSDGGRRPVIAIAGNHDNPDRIEAQDHFARECGIVFTGYPTTIVNPFQLSCNARVIRTAPGFVELRLPDHAAPVRILLTPYANETRMRRFLGIDQADDELRQHLHTHWQQLADQYMDEEGVNLLVAHLFFMKRDGEQPEEPEEERSILQVGGASMIFTDLIPAQVQYAALGHLHRYQSLDGGPCPVIYSSSPLAYSFAEADQQKYVVLIDAVPGQPVSYQPVPLTKGRRLLRKRFTQLTDAIEWLTANPDCFPEVTLQTETYLTSEERQQLARSHDRLVAIIPDIRPEAGEPTAESAGSQIDLTQSMTDLFTGYFKTQKKNQVPNERLLDLFKEVLNTTIE
ncbi:metallophosphoesterase family protein [Arsenicibacter rosenii]|uniref:Nuclease SbcCD subunit D n=1 Tax=Arsenicibacter rosenii TaxID=1750698 RepID=A0A1S2VEB3_9BACT|nr:exonuclease SbcCD subunit D [Arsenicibacter rosenii]OIN57064.1 exonuclease sbcCD subunit D [Arsenicibacter rosenii]